MIDRITVGAVLIATFAACGGSSGSEPNTADDAEAGDPDKSADANLGPRTLAEGTAVCLQEVSGQRYPIEDALKAQDLEPVDACIRADVLIQEEGQAGAFVLRYQMVGDAEWKECTSSVEDRLVFLDECTSQLVTELGTAGSTSSSAQSQQAE